MKLQYKKRGKLKNMQITVILQFGILNYFLVEKIKYLFQYAGKQYSKKTHQSWTSLWIML